LNGFHRAEGTQESDEHLVLVEERKVGLAGSVVGAVAQQLHDNIGYPENFGPFGKDLGAFGGVLRVGIAGLCARAGFHDNLHAGLCESGEHRGHQCDAPLPREVFSGNTNNHERSSDTTGQPNQGFRLGSVTGHCTPALLSKLEFTALPLRSANSCSPVIRANCRPECIAGPFVPQGKLPSAYIVEHDQRFTGLMGVCLWGMKMVAGGSMLNFFE